MAENLPATPSLEEVDAQRARLRKQRWVLAGIIAGAVVLVALIVVAVIFLARSPDTGKVRDIFIIFMALESLILGAALVVLIIQLASLINLLNNEVRPILRSTSDAVNTLRGTSEFLSENLVEPVIKLNSYMAGLKKVLDVLGLFRK